MFFMGGGRKGESFFLLFFLGFFYMCRICKNTIPTPVSFYPTPRTFLLQIYFYQILLYGLTLGDSPCHQVISQSFLIWLKLLFLLAQTSSYNIHCNICYFLYYPTAQKKCKLPFYYRGSYEGVRVRCTYKSYLVYNAFNRFYGCVVVGYNDLEFF